MIGLIDTNLFKKLTKNVDGIHETFVGVLGNELDITEWVVSPFGWLEYLGLTLRGSILIDPLPESWTLPDAVLIEHRPFIEEFGLEAVTHISWVRSNAKQRYAELLSKDMLVGKAAEELKYHSDVFNSGPFVDPLFRRPLAEYSVEQLVELLSIDCNRSRAFLCP